MTKDPIQTIEIGDGSKLVDLPLFLQTEYEQDDTLLAYPPETDFVNLRFTSLKISGPNPGCRGMEFVLRSAMEKGKNVREIGEKVILYYEEDSNSGGDDLLIKYWIIGLHDSVIIFSCTIDWVNLQDVLTARVEESIPEILQSIRSK